jgi:hypothetical protein
MKSVILTIVLAITVFAQTSFDGWTFIGKDTVSGTRYYVQSTHNPAKDGIREAWTRANLLDGTSDITLDGYDCAKQTSQMRQLIAFDKTGKTIANERYNNDPWKDTVPQSIGQAILKHVCQSSASPTPSNTPPATNNRPASLSWVKGDSASETITTGGVAYRFIQRPDGLIVGVAVTDRQLDSEGDLRKTALRVVLFNESENRVELDPTTITLTRLDQNKIIKRESAKQIASRFRTRLGIAAALGSIAASQQQEQTTSTTRGTISNSRGIGVGTYSGNTTTTTPDYEARARAQRQAQVWANNANVTAANMEQLELKAETIFARTAHTGYVFFERVKQCPSALVSFTLDGTEFQFPVSW